MFRHRWIWLFLFSILPVWRTPAWCTPGPRVAEETDLKAAYIFRFLSFVSWPEERAFALAPPPAAPALASGTLPAFFLTIHLLGKQQLGAALSPVHGRESRTPPRVFRVEDLGENWRGRNLGASRVLFLANSSASSWEEIFGILKDAPVLTIGEGSGFLEAGGMIRLLREGKNLRWEVNLARVQKAGLSISSQLLRNAVRVLK